MGHDYSKRMDRLLAMLRVIGSRPGLTLADLQKHFDLSERQVYRDLNCLRDAGFPCHHDPCVGGYAIGKGFFMPNVALTFEEAMALTTLMDHVPRDGQIPFFEIAEQAIDKIRSQLPDSIKEAIEPLDGHMTLDLARGQTGEDCRDAYDKIRDALQRRRVLKCRYDAANSNHTDDGVFDFRVYELWWAQRGWYALGHHSLRNDIRKLKVNRFEFLQITDQPYAIPDDFHLRDHLGLAWRMIRGETRHKIAVRFDPEFSFSVSETRWHPTQEEEWDGDHVTLRFEVDGLNEIVYWVMGYGAGAEVIEPKELRELVIDLASKMLGRYSSG